MPSVDGCHPPKIPILSKQGTSTAGLVPRTGTCCMKWLQGQLAWEASTSALLSWTETRGLPCMQADPGGRARFAVPVALRLQGAAARDSGRRRHVHQLWLPVDGAAPAGDPGAAYALCCCHGSPWKDLQVGRLGGPLPHPSRACECSAVNCSALERPFAAGDLKMHPCTLSLSWATAA